MANTKIYSTPEDIISRPQERDFGSDKVVFVKINTGEAVAYPKAYSLPMKMCEDCPFYKVDESTTPTAYYCQSQFVSSYNFAEAVRTKKVPENCKMWHTQQIRNACLNN